MVSCLTWRQATSGVNGVRPSSHRWCYQLVKTECVWPSEPFVHRHRPLCLQHLWYDAKVEQEVIVVVVSGMQLWDCVAPYVDIILHRGRFWAKSAASGSIRWCCFRSCLTVLSHVMWGRPGCLLQSTGGGTNRMFLTSALSSMRIICPNRVSWRDWIIAVSLGCFVSLHTSPLRTNWYHLMPSSICRHHWSSASILHAFIFDIAQQSKPYRNIGTMHMLYSFNFVEVASRDLQIWFSKLCMAARVMATADVTSATSCWVDKTAKVDKLLNRHDVLALNLNG